jgi:YVTN family beta-propeller protein
MKTRLFLRGPALAFALPAAVGALGAPFAYVPEEKSGTLTVIDTGTDEPIKEIPAGETPWGMVIR